MIVKISQLLEKVATLKAASTEEFRALRIRCPNKRGAVDDLMADLRSMTAEQKEGVGMGLNELRAEAQEKIDVLKEQFDDQSNEQDDLDLTHSACPVELGTRHPFSIIRNEVIDVFARLRLNTAEGLEIKDD